MSREGVLGDRFLEILAVVLLGVATVGTAWCGLQSTLWNGQQDDLAKATANERLEASRLFGLATQALVYDANLVTEYGQAIIDGDQRRQRFYRDFLMRPGLLPFLDSWQQQIESGGPTPNLLADEEYIDSVQAPYLDAEARADTLAERASAAGLTGDSYVLTTVLLAIALFFAGVTSSFRYPMMRTALLATSALAIAVAASRLIDLPVSETTWSL